MDNYTRAIMETSSEKTKRLLAELAEVEEETLNQPDGEYKDIMLEVIRKRHRQLLKDQLSDDE